MNRRTKFSLVAGALLWAGTTLSYGQRHLKGEHALSLQVGILDQIPSLKNWWADNQGYLTRLDFTRYTAREHYWSLGLQFDRKYYRPAGLSPAGVDLPRPLISERYTVHFSYSPASLHNYRRSYYISPVIGGLAGLELINRDQRAIPEGYLTAGSRATLGALVGLEAEVFVVNQLSLVGSLSERFYVLTDLNKLHSQGSIGLRYTIF